MKEVENDYKSLEYFKEFCSNADEVIDDLGLTEENYLRTMYENTTYMLPHKDGKFVMMKIGECPLYSPIDIGIAPVIEKLNEKGYRTDFCCEGHENDTHWQGYILFSGDLTEIQRRHIFDWIFNSMTDDRFGDSFWVKIDNGHRIRLGFHPSLCNRKSHNDMLMKLILGCDKYLVNSNR